MSLPFRSALAGLTALALLSPPLAGKVLAKDAYLVTATGGPGPGSPEKAAAFMEHIIIPSLDWLAGQVKEGKITGGLPVGDRAGVMILWADSNDEVDRILRGIPFWPFLEWEVVPLQSFQARADMEREAVEAMKEMRH